MIKRRRTLNWYESVAVWMATLFAIGVFYEVVRITLFADGSVEWVVEESQTHFARRRTRGLRMKYDVSVKGRESR